MRELSPELKLILEKYQAGTANAEEISLLNEWYHAFGYENAEIPVDPEELSQRISLRIRHSIAAEEVPVKRIRRRWMLPAAAVFLILVSSVLYFLLASSPAKELAKNLHPTPSITNDLAPGGNRAILTLADGSTIILDSANNGMLGRQGNIEIQKLDNGQLRYVVNGKEIFENDEAFYNTIATPRGGQYNVILSDGTVVWLNAASSIRFPVVFTGKERRVVLTGEAYFEVAKNSDKPFRIKAVKTEVEVIGTHFNINAYSDESDIRTTLLEGKVSVAVEGNPASAKTLTVNQQSVVSKNGMVKVVNNADTEEAVAWKNGRFQFNSADIKTIFRQISRWYDVDVEYRGNVDLHFTGQLNRNANVSGIFEKLALTGEVSFRIENRKIIVSR